MSELTLPERFHANLLQLITLAGDTVWWAKSNGLASILNYPTMLWAKNTLYYVSPEAAIDTFIEYTSEYWDEIKKQNHDFLTTKLGKMFPSLPSMYVNAVQDLFKEKLPEETLSSFWSLLQAMVRISKKHSEERAENDSSTP